MIELKNVARSVASRQLFTDVNLTIGDSGLRAIIGRNGEGKSTILKIIACIDNDFEGTRTVSKNTVISYTTQEHRGENRVVREYITSKLPLFSELNTIIDSSEEYLSGSESKMQRYYDAIDRFTSLGYFEIDSTLLRLSELVGFDSNKLAMHFNELSGGQQKLVDQITVMASPANVLLFDEPTNHMDFIAKERFLEWLKSQSSSILIVTHDRDVLDIVEEIYELKDRKLHYFPGNYNSYLNQNRIKTSSSIHQYEIDMRSLENLKKQLVEAKRKKEKCKSSPNPFVPLVDRLEREYKKIEAELEKPSAWIDSRSVTALKPEERARYEKFKSRNIRLHAQHESNRGSGVMLIDCNNVSVAYGNDSELFSPVTFRVSKGERVRLIGRNGAGKTSLINAIIGHITSNSNAEMRVSGQIKSAPLITIAEYKQSGEQIDGDATLFEIIQTILKDENKSHDETTVRKTMSRFLFHPMEDGEKKFSYLSGGEKARLNLLAILTKQPDVMILDEPTNHLDLPSIEELEKLIQNYSGAVLYVSHDSYFAKEIGGIGIKIEKSILA